MKYYIAISTDPMGYTHLVSFESKEEAKDHIKRNVYGGKGFIIVSEYFEEVE